MMQNLHLKVSLFGKHPSSSEYLHLGDFSPFIESVEKWIERGYETLLRKYRESYSQDTHHFYFLNRESDSFICGSVKLSRDNKRRNYPLSIVVEVSPYSSFSSSSDVLAYAKDMHQKILNIFALKCGVRELKEALKELSTTQESRRDREDEIYASSIFMSEDFSHEEHFYRPLESNDFIKMMR